MNFSAETIDLLARLIAPALFDIMALAALGAVVVMAVCETRSFARRRVFLEKLALQMGTMALGLLIVIIAASTAITAMAFGSTPWLAPWLSDPNSPMLAVYVTLGGTLLLLLVHRLTWNALPKGLHMTLGIITAIFALASLPASLFALKTLSSIPRAEDMAAILPTISIGPLPGASSPVWPMIAGILFMALAYAGTMGLIYLVRRRKRDDFGRDYYKFSLPMVARWAMFPAITMLICLGWLLGIISPEARNAVFESNLLVILIMSAVMLLGACGIWIIISRSQNPMRLKWTTALAGLMIWAMHTLLMFFCLGLYALTPM